MAQDLPDDVWSQIAETQRSDRESLHSMSLTSRRMRRLFVPVLFCRLQFDITRAESESLLVRLIRNIMRARFLFNSPELLRLTRFFAFRGTADAVRSMAKYLALQEGLDSSSSRGDAENFLAVLDDTIYRLISRMPGLRELQISNTVMTPLCYSAISSRPLLTLLRLKPRRSTDITYVTPALPYTPRLRDLACNYATRTGNERPTDPYITDILDHCILELEKLAMSSNLLPLVVSRIPLHRTLSLRSLLVVFPLYLSDGMVVAAFFHVLRACPQLRHLSLQGTVPDVEPTHYLPLNLPNLTTFSGTSRLLQIASGGTNLVKVDVYDDGYIKVQSLTQIIRSLPTHLRELSMTFVDFSQTPVDFLTFIRSLSVFRNLERLDIAYEYYEYYVSWKDSVEAQDSHGTIKYLLDQLASLRFLDIHCGSDGRAVEGYDVGCPISKQGEPADRGHPSLEQIYVDFICDMWSWDSQTGWKRSEWAGR